jgi:CheY-like chemotaxis protein
MHEALDSRKSVVVVDDDADVRATVRTLLEVRGYRVLTAGNGHEALELLSEHGAPGLILLDLRMPLMTGEQLLGLLQRDPVLREIPVVVVSGNDEQPPAGTQSCLMKPFRLRELLHVVRQYCG